jgi:hypothetical protein
MKVSNYLLALALGVTPAIALARPAAPASSPAQQTDRDDNRGYQGNSADLQRELSQRFPNSNMGVSYQNNNTVVLTGNVPNVQSRQYAEQIVRSRIGNAQLIDQVTVNGQAMSNYPNGAYPNGTYPSGTSSTYSNGDRDRDRNSGYSNQGDRDRDNTTNQGDRDNKQGDRDRGQDADRDHRMPQSDADANRDHRDRDAYKKDNDKKHNKNKDKDKEKKDKDQDNEKR